jgi:hypothetical protein
MTLAPLRVRFASVSPDPRRYQTLDKAGFGRGDFYAEPTPQIKLHKVGRLWHLGKLIFEKNWPGTA